MSATAEAVFEAHEEQPPHAPLGRAPCEGETFAMDGEGLRCRVFDGVIHPPFITAQGLRRAAGYVPAETDIFIATYPKCGTTWMQQIVLLLLHGGREEEVPDTMKASPWFENTASGLPEDAAEVPCPLHGGRRVWKTHSDAAHLPFAQRTEGVKMVVVTRNPFDTAVSYYHHNRDLGPMMSYSGNFDHFLTEIFMQRKAHYGDFWEWHAGHWAHYQEAQKAGGWVLWISYEEMKSDPVAAVRKVAAHCAIEASEEVVQRVAGQTDFQKMKQHFEQSMEVRAAKGEFVKKNHLRQGLSGAWKKTFTVAQRDALEALHEARCSELGLPRELFPY